jgi:cytochrome P450
LLSTAPPARRRLEAELDEVLGSRLPSPRDLPALPYLGQVVRESLRLYPPAWVVGRGAAEDDEIDGYFIPRGSLVFVSPWVTHRHPGVWDDPEGFDPDRFAPDRVAAMPRFSFFPFGGGPRQCIGNGFAMMEAQLVLATLLRRLRLDLLPGVPVVPEAVVTLRPKHGLWMRPVERSKSAG